MLQIPFLLEKNTKLICGNGAITQISDLLHQLGTKRILLVTDPGVVTAGIVKQVTDYLSKETIQYFIFDEVEPNPSWQTAEMIVTQYQEQNCSGIVAVGGGSPMDAAKGAGIIITNEGDLFEYVDQREIPNALPPLVAIPTTVGSGSEVSRFAVLSDPDACNKLIFISDRLVPDKAILDPELVLSLPAPLVAATGIDTLTHAIEAMLSLFADSSSEVAAIEALGLIRQYLLPAVQADCSAIEGQIARSQMLYASTLAGMAASKAFVGLVHGMSHPLTNYYGIPHGLANAILLPHVLAFYDPQSVSALTRVAEAMGYMNNAAAIDAIHELNAQLNIPSTLSELDVTEDFIDQMAKDAFESGNVQIVSPQKPTLEQIIKLYRQAL